MGEPRPAPVVREVQDELVAAFAQLREQARLAPQLHQRALALPLAVDGVDAGDARVAGQHVGRVGVDERVDLRLRRARGEHREDGRGKEDVAVVAQLHHQHAPQGIDADRVGNHGRQISKYGRQNASKRTLSRKDRRGAS
jgi:hypothetical protein